MPLWCQNETQVQWTFHTIQWQSFQIVHLTEIINDAVMYLHDPQLKYKVFLGLFCPQNLQHSIMDCFFLWLCPLLN